MTTNNSHIASTSALLAAEAAVRAQQGAYANVRGRPALAAMVVDGFIAIETITGTVSIEDQALLLSRHQVNVATGSTSKYSPFIATIWGEFDFGKRKVPDLDDIERDAWVPNKTMAVYFHTMETLHEKGWNENTDRQEMIDFIIKSGGAQKVANDRKTDIAKQGKPSRDRTEKEQRELYLEEGPSRPIDLPIEELNLDAKAGKFVSIILERSDDGKLIYRGVQSANASGALTKLASQNFDRLFTAREEGKLIDLRIEKARKEAREAAFAEVRQG